MVTLLHEVAAVLDGEVVVDRCVRAVARREVREGLGVDVKVILTQPCIYLYR